MNIKKSKIDSALFLCFVFFFMAVHIQAHIGSRSLFAKNEDPLNMDRSLSVKNFPGNEQARLRPAGNGSQFGNFAMTVMAGVAGNLAGIYAGALLGSSSYPGIVLGGIAGSAGGSALGVFIAGSSGGRGGNFGSALGGSLLGEVAAVALAFIIPARGESEFAFPLGFLILPPLGAAIVFNSSLSSRSFQAGNGFLNLAGGKLGIGVPDVQVRPSYVPGLKVKRELQFNVRVLSVEL